MIKKKCRGPTRCADINNLEAKLEIHCDERNQLVGPNSVKLASLLGVLAREMVPITYFDWRKVPIQIKEYLVRIINVSIINLYICYLHLYFCMLSMLIFKQWMT